MKMYALYDNAGTTFAVPQNFYEDVIALAPRYIKGRETLDKVLQNMKLRKEGKESTTPQSLFDVICDVLVKASEEGSYKISGGGLLYPDTAEQLRRHRELGKTALLTSGTQEFTRRFLDFELDGVNFNGYFDRILTGPEVGDKDDKKAFFRLYDGLEGGIDSVFDDKISVAKAALLASKGVGVPFHVYLVDRKERYIGNPSVAELQRQFPNFIRIRTFADLRGSR